MDDELRTMHEAQVLRERLRVLAGVQASYRDALLDAGLEPSMAEQLVLEWSRVAWPLTLRALPEPPSIEQPQVTLQELLGRAEERRDPSRVPDGEPWLQPVEDLIDEDDEHSERRAA